MRLCMYHIYTPVLVPRPPLYFFVVDLYYKKEVVCVQEQYTPTFLEELIVESRAHRAISCKYDPTITFFYLIHIE